MKKWSQLLSEIVLPDGGFYLVEGKVKAREPSSDELSWLPIWLCLVFERHDGDRTGRHDWAWIPGKTQHVTAMHMTRGKPGTPLRLFVESDKEVEIAMSQFKVYPLTTGREVIDIDKGDRTQ